MNKAKTQYKTMGGG